MNLNAYLDAMLVCRPSGPHSYTYEPLAGRELAPLLRVGYRLIGYLKVGASRLDFDFAAGPSSEDVSEMRGWADARALAMRPILDRYARLTARLAWFLRGQAPSEFMLGNQNASMIGPQAMYLAAVADAVAAVDETTALRDLPGVAGELRVLAEECSAIDAAHPVATYIPTRALAAIVVDGQRIPDPQD